MHETLAKITPPGTYVQVYREDTTYSKGTVVKTITRKGITLFVIDLDEGEQITTHPWNVEPTIGKFPAWKRKR